MSVETTLMTILETKLYLVAPRKLRKRLFTETNVTLNKTLEIANVIENALTLSNKIEENHTKNEHANKVGVYTA